MLKVRIMPTLLYKDTTLVKGVSFNSWRRVASVMQAVEVYNTRQVDELVFLDITATSGGRRPDFALVDDFADVCFMPLTVGGGIREVDDVKQLLACGADKVAINTAAIQTPDLITRVADKFGSQCVVVSIDARSAGNGSWEVFTHSGTRPSGKGPVEAAIASEKAGAGEILLTSIERDGTMEGYDIAMIKAVAEAVKIPVIASGGAGNYEHMYQALKEGGASAVAAASIFHFTQQTPLEAKNFLKSRGVAVRN
jgi:cyclase